MPDLDLWRAEHVHGTGRLCPRRRFDPLDVLAVVAAVAVAVAVCLGRPALSSSGGARRAGR